MMSQAKLEQTLPLIQNAAKALVKIDFIFSCSDGLSNHKHFDKSVKGFGRS